MPKLNTMKNTHTTPRPEWLDAKGVDAVFSICKSTTYRLAAEGKIVSCSLRERGKLRGKRLFSYLSISELLMRRATGGEEAAQ
jgi:hypothetical protein